MAKHKKHDPAPEPLQELAHVEKLSEPETVLSEPEPVPEPAPTPAPAAPKKAPKPVAKAPSQLAATLGNPADVNFDAPNVCKIGTAPDARGKNRKQDQSEE